MFNSQPAARVGICTLPRIHGTLVFGLRNHCPLHIVQHWCHCANVSEKSWIYICEEFQMNLVLEKCIKYQCFGALLKIGQRQICSIMIRPRSH